MKELYTIRLRFFNFFKCAKLIFAIFLATAIISNSVNAQSITVTTTVDEVNGNTANIAALAGTPGGAGVSLREAVIATNNEPGGATITINLPAGNYTLTLTGSGENSAATGDLDFTGPASGTKTINIVGAGAATTTITGSGDRILDLEPSNTPGDLTVNISGITFTGGNLPTASGGAILAGFLNNVTNINNCVFTNNTAPSNGGAISESSAGTVHTLTITNTTFTNNTATAAVGGAVSYNGVGNVTITGCTFTGNTAGTQGGAINISGTAPGPVTTNILRNTFTGNTANGATFGGAAVAVVNAQTLTINFNRIVGNTAPNVATGKMISTGGGAVIAMNTNNNWWGVNTGPAAADILGTAAANWLQLKATASPSTICPTAPGNTSTVTASFLSNSAGTAISPSDLSAIIGLPITFTATLGTLSAAQTTIQPSGTATVTFTATGTGTGSVNAQVDNVPSNDPVAKATINITAPVINSIDKTDPNCADPASGTITINATGAPTLEYSINGGANWFTTNIFTGLTAGTYPVSVRSTSNTNCVTNGSVTLNPATGCTDCSIDGPANVCPGSTNTHASTVTPPGGTIVHSWSITGSGTINGSTTGSSVSVTAGSSGSYTLTDNFTQDGSPGSCTKTVTVSDVTPPTITCPANITMNNDNNQCGATVSFTATASDNCPGTVGISYSPASGSFFPVGTTTVTATATDANSNTASCTFTVTVVDAQNPSVTCPANITVNNDANQCGAVVTFIATATDNCPGVSVSASPASGSFFPVGTTTVTATATDAAGRTATCTFTVTVVDAQNPSITCPANITQNNDNNQCGAVVTYAATATDNCPGVSVSYSPASGSFFPVGTTTVTATATDAVGHTASCTFTVTVVDAQNPSITCPANITQNNDANQCGAVVTYAAIASDNCPGVSVSYSPASGSFFPVGTTTVTATATDAIGRTSSCTFTVTVVDAQNPSITCPANITQNNDNNQCGAVVTYSATATDNCPGVSVSYSPASGSFFPVGTTTVTATATDASGRTATCTFTVTVVDAQNPTFTFCPGNQTFNNDANQCGAQIGFFATATDNCPGVSISYSPASFSFFPVGTTTVTATATDAAGRTATCTFDVTVVDAQNPSITCPANITQNNDPNQCGAVVTYAATASDNCPGVSVSYSPASGSFFPVGTTTVTATATDAVGRTASCTFTVTVVDAQNPSITCPANITVNSPTGQCGTVVTYAATASDNCPGVTVSYSPASGSTFPTGTTTVTATATDASGRTSTCTFTVTVVDTQNPTITCPANIVVNNTPGQCGAFVSFSATPNDNCPGVTVSYSKAPGSFFAIGTTTVTATATDAGGRTATCTFTVKVVDTEAPTLTCPANVTETITSGCSKKLTPPQPTVSDNCTLSKLTWCLTGATTGDSPSSGINYVGNKTFNAGVTTVTYTAKDIYGNTSECSFTISILETVLPNITCPPNKTVSTNYGYCYWSHVNLGTPKVSDNCGVLCVTNNAPDTFQLGTTIVTWTVTDNSGNTRSCNQTITVQDQQTPSVTCPANIYQDASVNCVTTVTTPDPIYYDNCTVAKLTWVMTGATTGSSPNTGINVVGTKNFNVGTTTITYTVKDAANNSWSCSFAVTITDKTRPTITCPANILQTAAAGTCNRSILTPDPTYSDNCGVTKLTWYMEGATNASSPSSGINKVATKTFNVGVTTVTYTASDSWGNSKQCTFTVTVTDNQAPVVSCPSDQTFCKKSNNTYTIPAMTRSDNCSIANTTYQVTGVTTRSGSGTNASGTFNLGLSTITWTVTDASGNTSTCSTNVTIVPAGSCRTVSTETPPVDPKSTTTARGKLDIIVEDSKLGVTAYPNPTEYYFNVKVKSSGKETVEIRMYDGLGKVVQVKRGAPDQTYRFGDNVAGGIYIIEVRQGGQIATIKVMKE